MKTTTLLASAVLVALAAQASAQTFDLSMKPTKGGKSVYGLTFNIDGQGQVITYKAKVSNETVEVKEDGSYLVASYQTDHQVLVGGQPMQAASETITSVTTYDKFGKPIAMGGDNANAVSYRVANLTSFIASVAPMKVGESWKVAILADKEKGTVSATHNYKLLSVEKQGGKDVAVVEFTVTETGGASPANAKGKVWIEVGSGEMVRYEAEMKNMPSDGGPVSGKVVIVRQPAAA